MTDTKLGKLFRLMGSSNDGEALAAARSFLKECQRTGLDFQQLSDKLSSEDDTEDSFMNEMNAAYQKRKEERLNLTPAQVRWMARYLVGMPKKYGGDDMPNWHERLLTKAEATPDALTHKERVELHTTFCHGYARCEGNERDEVEVAKRKVEREFMDRRFKAQAKLGLGWNLGEFLDPNDLPASLTRTRLNAKDAT